jgi:hypothetical protein
MNIGGSVPSTMCSELWRYNESGAFSYLYAIARERNEWNLCWPRFRAHVLARQLILRIRVAVWRHWCTLGSLTNTSKAS